MALGVGEALVSFLDESGIPTIVERAKILPPQSLMGPAEAEYVSQLIAASEFDLKYRTPVDRESAYEIIIKANAELDAQRQRDAEEAAAQAEAEKEAAAAEKQKAKEEAAAQKAAEKEAAAAQKAAEKEAAKAAKEAEKEAQAKKNVVKRAATNAASTVARSITTNMVNTVAGGKKTDAATIAKRAATNALSSVMRSGSAAIIRGLFDTKK